MLIIKILLMPLKGPDNPLFCHYFCYYLKWVYDNERFTIGDFLNCSYEGLGEKISDLLSHSYFARFPVSVHRLGLQFIMISTPVCGGQVSNKLRLQLLNPTQY